MENRKFDRLGIDISLLGFGCMRFPLQEDGRIDEKEAEKMLDTAIAAGVNYIDTAYPYHEGDSEPFVGRVLDKYDRSSYYLATKLPLWSVHTLEDAKRLFESQLQRLHKDYVDFYLLHAVNKDTWKKVLDLGILPYLDEEKKAGRIKNLGFSFHDHYEVFEEMIHYRDWDFCQIQLNYMDTDTQAGMKGYELTVKKGIPLVIMEPVKGGSLAGFSGDIDKIFKDENPDASIASWALRWVGSLPNVKVILSGMSTQEQVEDNLATFADFKPLTSGEKEAVDKVIHTLRSRLQNGCTACRYCMPCPAGVDIPGNFSVWNNYHVFLNYDIVSYDWENNLADSVKAKNCIKCGKCEQVCPQKIAIRENLERLQADLEKAEKEKKDKENR